MEDSTEELEKMETGLAREVKLLDSDARVKKHDRG